MGLAETARLVARLDLEGNFQQRLRGANTALGNLNSKFSNTSRALGKTAQNLQFIGLAAAGAVAGFTVAGINLAADFEASLNTINTIARATPEALGKIGDSIRKVARDTGTSLEDLTTGYYDLLSAGIKAADAQGVLTAANTLSIGAISTTAEAVDLLTTAINVYGGDASKAAQFADEFAVAVERGKVKASEIAGSYAQVAPLAKSLNIENKELAAGYARLTASGTPAAEAATQMASAMTALLKTTPGLEALQKKTGKVYSAIAGDQGLNEALEQMRNDAKKAGIELIDLVGRKEALLYILQSTGPAFAAYNADLAAMGAASGTAAEQMGIRQQGLNFQLARLKANLKDAGITIGSALLPKLTPLIEKLTGFINDNQGKIAQFGTDLANTFERVAAAIGAFDWSPFIAGLKMSADIAKTTIGVFRSLPEGLQTALIGGFALNKLTGGLVTGFAKDLGKIGLEKFLMRGSPINPMYVVPMGPGLTPPPGGAPTPGGMPTPGGKPTLLDGGFGSKLITSAALATVIADIPRTVDTLFAPGATAGGSVHWDPTRKQFVSSNATGAARTPTTAGAPPGVRGIGKDIGAAVRAGMTDIGREIAGAMAATHGALDTEIGKKGGAFLRAGDKAKTLDENAGKLVALFESSTNPSLHSMETNLGILQGLAAQGDTKTRQALSDDIKALKALIGEKLDALKAAMAPFAMAMDPNSAWRQQEFGVTVNVYNAGPTARDTTNAVTKYNRFTTARPT